MMLRRMYERCLRYHLVDSRQETVIQKPGTKDRAFCALAGGILDGFAAFFDILAGTTNSVTTREDTCAE